MESLNQFKRTGLALAISLVSLNALAAPVDATNTLPNAKPGECYAKVVVPARITVASNISSSRSVRSPYRPTAEYAVDDE